MKIVKAETKEKQIKVLKILELEGYKWHNGKSPTGHIPYERGRKLGIDIPYICLYENNKTLIASRRLYHGFEAIPYEEFISKQKR